jgi:hypothetical protein
MADTNITFHIGVEGAQLAQKQMENFENGTKKAILEANAAFLLQEKQMEENLKVIRKYKENMANVREIQAFNKATANGTMALRDFGRVAEDAGYGLIAIQNNIVPALQSFQQLKMETGSAMGAIKAMVSSLTGIGGLIFAYQLVSSALVMYLNHSRSAKTATDELAASASTAVNKLLEVTDPFKNYKYVFENIAKAQEGIKLLKMSLDQQVGGLVGSVKTNMGPGQNPYASTGGNNTYTYNKQELLGMIKYDDKGQATVDKKLLESLGTEKAKNQFAQFATALGTLTKKLEQYEVDEYIANVLAMAGSTKTFTGKTKTNQYNRPGYGDPRSEAMSAQGRRVAGWDAMNRDNSGQSMLNYILKNGVRRGEYQKNPSLNYVENARERSMWEGSQKYFGAGMSDKTGKGANALPFDKNDLKKQYDIFTDMGISSANVVANSFSTAFRSVFGEANSLLEQLALNATDVLGNFLTKWGLGSLISAIPGGGAIGGALLESVGISGNVTQTGKTPSQGAAASIKSLQNRRVLK